MPGTDVGGAAGGIIRRVRLASGRLKPRRLVAARSIDEVDQVRPAPAATGSGAKAFAQLRSALGPMEANEIEDLAFAHMKAQANFVIEIHAAPKGSLKNNLGIWPVSNLEAQCPSI